MRTTSTTTIKKAIACAVAGIGLAAGLVACSEGSGLSGEYYDDEGQVIIQGDSVAFYPFGCSDAVEGGLSENGAQVVWASDDEHLGSDRIGARPHWSPLAPTMQSSWTAAGSSRWKRTRP